MSSMTAVEQFARAPVCSLIGWFALEDHLASAAACPIRVAIALRWPPNRCELLLVGSLSVLWKKIADGRAAIAHRGPRDVRNGRWSMVGWRWLTPVRAAAAGREWRRLRRRPLGIVALKNYPQPRWGHKGFNAARRYGD
jgi:hypothetical protein